MFKTHRLILTAIFIALIMACPALFAKTDLTVQAKQQVKTVFKDIKEDTQYGYLITGSEQTMPNMDSHETLTLPAQTQLTEFYGKKIHSDGKIYFVTLWNAIDANDESPGGGAGILSVFSQPDNKLLDMLNVKTDISVYFSELPSPILGKNETFVISNSHFNSSESYLDNSLFHIYHGKLQKIDSIFTFSTHSGCNDFDELLSWKTDKTVSGDYPPLIATVTLKKKAKHNENSECANKTNNVRNRTFTKIYNWDNKKQHYHGDDKSFKQLQRFNEQNL